jgi:cellulose synthase/poly-beta-1,6-N-acetylglucosamine synthase-like glycosyltransferase
MWAYRIFSWITLIISILIFVAIPIYIISSLFLIFSYIDFATMLLNVLLLLIEVFGFLFAFYLFYMISGAFRFRYKSILFNQGEFSKNPFFSIIVPSHGTSFPILKKTLEGALKIDYKNYEIIVSDNGQDLNVTKQLKEYCGKSHIQFHHKRDRRGFKAGNINAVLDKTKGEYIVILDSDHVAVPTLLTEFSKVLSNKNIGYIQAKVAYRNTQRLYQAANSILYSQFYEVFEAAKDQRGVVLFNGTTGCFRKDVLVKVGGFSEDTLIEDIDTSMKILSQGYEGRYLDFIGSYGLVPASAKSQIAQLWRWSTGATSVLRLRLRMILGSESLSWFKKLELILNAMAFFSGISVVLLMTLLAVSILGDIPFLRPQIFGVHSGYIMPSLVGVSYTMSAFLAILWEPRQQHLLNRVIQLIPFYLFSLGTFLFLISGVIEGLLLKTTTLSSGALWTREVRVVRNSLIALAFCAILILIGVLHLSHPFAPMVVGGVIGWILAPLMLLYEEVFPPQEGE